MKPFLVLIFGPPGSGKSTQAENVAKKFDAVHVDTGELLRRILHDPARQHDPKIREERIKHETDGQLNDSLWVGGIVNDELRKLATDGKSVASSGFPRTIFEAEIELPVMRELFRERIFAFILRVGEETSLFRNSRRRICTKCHKPHQKANAAPF
ncbi:MAG: Adenylate kinase [Parcubacteria group bacterium GW2011_GWA1_51_12]|nr:MAG: Adenylate kinase [Parcubacteria group bacterium GW2011_GWA1_51_12]